MKVLVERHAHEEPVTLKITCPRCHSELLIEKRDAIDARFAKVKMKYMTDAVGQVVSEEVPDYSDTYKATVVLCPVCNRYFKQEGRNCFISLIDKRIM